MLNVDRTANSQMLKSQASVSQFFFQERAVNM